MSVPYYGDFPEDHTDVRIRFNTFDSNDPSESVTITDLIDSDIKVHKDGGTTEIATDGASVVINFDSRTGAHVITIDTSAHSDYSTGSEYGVLIEGTTVDGGTVTAWVGCFSIERAGGTIALLKLIQAATITNAAGTDIAADIIALDTVADGIKVVTDALTAAAATKLALSAGSMVVGTVSWDNTNSTTTVIYCSDITEATAEHFNGRQLIFTSGAMKDQATDIEGYALVSGEGEFTVVATTENPADDVTFIIV